MGLILSSVFILKSNEPFLLLSREYAALQPLGIKRKRKAIVGRIGLWLRSDTNPIIESERVRDSSMIVVV